MYRSALASQAVAEKRLEYDETVEKANKTDALYKKTRVELAQLKQSCDEEAPIMDADGNDLPIKAELEALPFETVQEAELAVRVECAVSNIISINSPYRVLTPRFCYYFNTLRYHRPSYNIVGGGGAKNQFKPLRS